MIVVVSGSKRTGTSMMVRALYHASTGLDLLVAPSMEQANPEHEGYQPNPNGLYEVGLVRYLEPRFLRKIPDNSILKILYDGLPNLPKGDYKVIFMERDPDEITASSERVEKHWDAIDHHFDGDKCKVEHKSGLEMAKMLPFCSLRPYNQDDIDHVLGIMQTRWDVDLVRVSYNDVINDPLTAFKRIKHNGLGKVRFEFDVEKAASLVDPQLYRSRS